jgi:molybdate transport system substrate-binding protein
MGRAAFAAALLFSASTASADTIKVLTSGAFKQVVLAFVPPFEASSGHKVEVFEGTAGALQKRVDGGETFDVAIITPPVLKQYAEQGKVVPASVVTLAKVGAGVGVKAGSLLPEIRTVEQFRQTVLNARAVAYIDPAAGGSSGIYLQGLFERLGIASQVAAKAVLVRGGYSAARIISGEADIAIQQISEILPVAGVTLVGPLPEEIQNYTQYAGGVATTSAHGAAAQAFLSTMSAASAADTIRAKGMTPP